MADFVILENQSEHVDRAGQPDVGDADEIIDDSAGIDSNDFKGEEPGASGELQSKEAGVESGGDEVIENIDSNENTSDSTSASEIGGSKNLGESDRFIGLKARYPVFFWTKPLESASLLLCGVSLYTYTLHFHLLTLFPLLVLLNIFLNLAIISLRVPLTYFGFRSPEAEPRDDFVLNFGEMAEEVLEDDRLLQVVSSLVSFAKDAKNGVRDTMQSDHAPSYAKLFLKAVLFHAVVSFVSIRDILFFTFFSAMILTPLYTVYYGQVDELFMAAEDGARRIGLFLAQIIDSRVPIISRCFRRLGFEMGRPVPLSTTKVKRS